VGGGTAWASTDAVAQGLAASRPPNPIQIYANANGCIWDGASGHDVGPCINAAIAQAAALGGAEVIVPSIPGGVAYAATNILNTSSGVRIRAAGWGPPRNASVNSIQPALKIIYNGSAEAGPFVQVVPLSTLPISDAGIVGIGFDCNSLVDTCVNIRDVTYSTFQFDQGGARKTGVLFDTGVTNPGTQFNDVWVAANNTNPSYCASGIVLDKGVSSTGNTSYNHFHLLYAAYGCGDGIVRGANDSNVYDVVSAYHYGTATSGSPGIDTNTAYTPPSGVPTHNYSNDNLTLFTGIPFWHQGFTQGAVWAANGGNVGTMAYAPVTLTTNAASNTSTSTLSFAAVSGVVTGQGVTCGGVTSGIYPNTYVTTVSGTTIGLQRYPVAGGGFSGVASGQSCTFGLYVNSSAAPGPYTITALSGSTVSVTASAGGTSQASVPISGGAIKAADFTIPVTGTPTAGDYWTLTVATPSQMSQTIHTDKANNVSDGGYEQGATGLDTFAGQKAFYGDSTHCMAFYSMTGAALSGQACNGNGGLFGGQSGGVAGTNPVGWGGSNNYILYPAVNACYLGGIGNTVSGNYSCIVGGNGANDRGRRAVTCFAAGSFATQGDAQICTTVLRGTGASATAFRLTNDGATAGTANCVNIPNNTSYAVTYSVHVVDHTGITTKGVTWTNGTGTLYRGANAASTTWLPITSPAFGSFGTVTGSSLALSADTTNGCLSLVFTPPTGNSDTLNAVARVETVEVQ